MKKNKKGFTLIELLAVIVILAILVAVAIPAITRYLNQARRGTFAANAQAAISAIRNEIITEGITTNSYFTIEEVNKLLDKKLENSPYGSPYNLDTSYVKVTFDTVGNATYSICLTDGNNGFNGTDGHANDTLEIDVTEANVKYGQNVTCTLPDGNSGYAAKTVSQK